MVFSTNLGVAMGDSKQLSPGELGVGLAASEEPELIAAPKRGCGGIMEKKMETTGVIGVIWGLYRDYRVYRTPL